MLYWMWFVVAVILVLVEFVTPSGFILFFLSVPAAAMGVLMLVLPDLAWFYQLGIYALLAVGAYWLWRGRIRGDHLTPEVQVNNRAARYIGLVVTLEKPIYNGSGHVTLEQSQWKVYGPDLAAGRKVKLVKTDGVTFNVEAAD